MGVIGPFTSDEWLILKVLKMSIADMERRSSNYSTAIKKNKRLFKNIIAKYAEST